MRQKQRKTYNNDFDFRDKRREQRKAYYQKVKLEQGWELLIQGHKHVKYNIGNS